MKYLINTFKRNTYLIKLALPIFLELILQMLIGSVDQLMLTGNKTAVNGIIQANTLTNLVLIVFSVLSTASIILITQLNASGNKESADKIYALSFYFNLVIGILFSAFLYFFCEYIFVAMKVDSSVMDEACSYMRLTGTFIVFQAMITTFSAYFRSNKLMIQSTIITLVMNIVNIVGNAILIYGFKMGVVGAGISSTACRLAGLIIIIIVYVKYINISLSIKQLMPFPRVLFGKLLKIGIPSAGENFSYNFSQIVILSILNSTSSGVLAGNIKGYITTFTMIVYMFANGIVQAMQVLEGEYIGSNQMDKADKLFKDTVVMSITISTIMSIILWSVSYPLFMIIMKDSEAAKLAFIALSIDILLEVGRACNIISVRALQTAGDINFPVLLSILSCWLFAVGGTYVLGIPLNLGLIGCWISMCFDECFRAVVFCIRWKHGKWKNKHLLTGIEKSKNNKFSTI